MSTIPTGPLPPPSSPSPLKAVLWEYYNIALEHGYLRCLLGVLDKDEVEARAQKLEVGLSICTARLATMGGDYPGFLETVVKGELLSSCKSQAGLVRKSNNGPAILPLQYWLEGMESLQTGTSLSNVAEVVSQYSRERLLLNKLQEETLQKIISLLEKSEQQDFLRRIIDPTQRNLLQQSVMGRVKDGLARLQMQLVLAAQLNTFVIAWKIWQYRK